MTTTRTFDVNVPKEVQLEVRRNMRRDGWTYKSTTDEKDKHGKPLRVQHYEQSQPSSERPIKEDTDD